jgi:hypothetical protein
MALFKPLVGSGLALASRASQPVLNRAVQQDWLLLKILSLHSLETGDLFIEKRFRLFELDVIKSLLRNQLVFVFLFLLEQFNQNVCLFYLRFFVFGLLFEPFDWDVALPNSFLKGKYVKFKLLDFVFNAFDMKLQLLLNADVFSNISL